MKVFRTAEWLKKKVLVVPELDLSNLSCTVYFLS